MLSPLRVDAPSSILDALAARGRTEDVAFSPDNRRVAVAGLDSHSVTLIDIELRFAPEPSVALTGFTELRSSEFASPHGVAFLDDQLLAVANRDGAVVILRVPSPTTDAELATIEPMMVIDGGDDPIASPGSLAATQHGPDLYELLVCNNYVHRVTRHVVDTRAQQVISEELLLTAGLAVPDGITISNNGRWIAVSSHDTARVLIFENSPQLGPDTPATCELLDIAFPHGLRFTTDDARLIVAAAGAPHVVVFERGDADWSGARDASATIQVIPDADFRLLHTNEQEGGPKGVDIDRTGTVVAITNERMPLQFFALAGAQAVCAAATDETTSLEAMRSALINALERPKALEQLAGQLERDLAAQTTRIAELERALTRTREMVFAQQAFVEQARQAAEDRATGRTDSVGS